MRYALQALRQALQTARKKLARRLLHLFLFWKPEAVRLQAERRLRGREQVAKLRRADIVFVSFGKSGRTWLRVMLSRLFQLRNGLPESTLIGFDNYHNVDRSIPKMFFTHDNYVKDFTGNVDNKADYYDSRVVLMARDPRDVAVSQFFQWKFRMKPKKKAINDYPEEGAEVELFEFVMDEDAGLGKVIGFLNLWAREAPRVRAFHLLRYEDLRRDPQAEMERLVEFMGIPASADEVRQAVEFGAYENMRRMEEKQALRLAGGRMVPKDRDNPDSYKVRRAKVGGYRDYFDDEQVARIDALLRERLDPLFGYGTESADAASGGTSTP